MAGSAVLAKNALLVGGGAAAGAGAAIGVPMLMGKDDENKKEIPDGLQDSSIKWDLNLAMQDESLFTSFNKPGDCIKKSFPGIERSKEHNEDNQRGFFHKPNSVGRRVITTPFTTVDVNNESNSVTSPDFACLMSNEHADAFDKEFRAELVLKKGDVGYIWMSGWKKDEGNHNFYLREAVVKKENGVWNGYVGIDVKYSDSDKQSIAPRFDTVHFPNLETRKVWECKDASKKEGCIKKKSHVAVWAKKDNNGKNFLPNNEKDLSKSILSLSGNRGYDISGKKERQSVYGNNAWYRSAEQTQPMIIFNKEQVFPSNYKGEWKDIVSFCQTPSSAEPYALFCS